ncbi:facilitated trehalose transporter Tret1-2 homolog [Xylocopa sonorina]|uniref:facilitated trehalose transporter Tret1-2 homolog n=1 Tax=Xylocopa sonorina TaxID=1818115 RepID=UPI00403AB671
MLNYGRSDYAKVVKVDNVCDDIENNNTRDKANTLDVNYDALHHSSNRKGVLAQCLVSGAVLILSAGGGMPIGYSAILLPQLAEENGTMHADAELGSWIASIHSLATPVGSLVSGPLLDTIGRRGALQFSGVPLFAGWILIGFANNIPCLLVGRVILGFAVGIMAVPSQVLLGEMSDPKLRGFLASNPLSFYCLGVLIIYALGASFTWHIVAFSSAILPIIALIALVLIPESPIWLVKRKKLEKARKALLWLRGDNVEQVNAEMLILEARAKADLIQTSTNTSWLKKISSAISTLLDPSVFKPLTIINIFNALHLIGGTFVTIFYAVNIITEITGDSINSYLAAVVMAAIRFFSSIIGTVALLKVNRRSLGIFSALGTAITSLILVVYMLIEEKSSINTYVVVFLLSMYVAASTVGLMTLIGLMISELLPQKARGIGGGLNYFFINTVIFIIIKIYPMLNNAIGITGIFVIFAIFALLETIFIYIALPETRNRTLQEIEDYFQQDNLLWITRSREKRKDEPFIIHKS